MSWWNGEPGGWFNRTEEEERLMKGPLSGRPPMFPWDQDANIRHNMAIEQEAKKAAMLANNPALRARLEAEAEGRDNVVQPMGYEKYGDYDWLGGRKVRPYYSEEDQLELNRIHRDKLDTQDYINSMGIPFSGATQAGPLSNPYK